MDELIAACLQKPGAYLDYPFTPYFPVVKVKAPSQPKGRIFAQVFLLHGEPKVTLNCTPASAAYYRKPIPARSRAVGTVRRYSSRISTP